jgi:hypothetical protein
LSPACFTRCITTLSYLVFPSFKIKEKREIAQIQQSVVKIFRIAPEHERIRTESNKNNRICNENSAEEKQPRNKKPRNIEKDRNSARRNNSQ